MLGHRPPARPDAQQPAHPSSAIVCRHYDTRAVQCAVIGALGDSQPTRAPLGERRRRTCSGGRRRHSCCSPACSLAFWPGCSGRTPAIGGRAAAPAAQPGAVAPAVGAAAACRLAARARAATRWNSDGDGSSRRGGSGGSSGTGRQQEPRRRGPAGSYPGSAQERHPYLLCRCCAGGDPGRVCWVTATRPHQQPVGATGRQACRACATAQHTTAEPSRWETGAGARRPVSTAQVLALNCVCYCMQAGNCCTFAT